MRKFRSQPVWLSLPIIDSRAKHAAGGLVIKKIHERLAVGGVCI